MLHLLPYELLSKVLMHVSVERLAWIEYHHAPMHRWLKSARRFWREYAHTHYRVISVCNEVRLTKIAWMGENGELAREMCTDRAVFIGRDHAHAMLDKCSDCGGYVLPDRSNAWMRARLWSYVPRYLMNGVRSRLRVYRLHHYLRRQGLFAWQAERAKARAWETLVARLHKSVRPVLSAEDVQKWNEKSVNELVYLFQHHTLPLS